MIGRIYCIAANTFLEAVRQKFFNSLLLISIALVLSANFFQQFDFGTSELKFITDFGFGALFFFGSILAITATTQLFFNEIENRTALTMLAKPVYKLEFLAGKFFGAQLLMLVFTVVLSVVLAGILWWREAAILGQHGSGGHDVQSLVRYSDIAVFGLLQWMKFGVICAISLFIGSFSNTNLFTIIVSFFVLLICQLQYIARDAYMDMEQGPLRWIVNLLALVFPNFQLFNVGDQLVYIEHAGLSAMSVIQVVGYAAIYALVFLLLAFLNFRKREI